MSFGFLNALMLLGLAGLAIPPIVHLLNRRRFDVVDWGAMQFLQISETTRRRLLIEELLLMLLRMGLIGLAVLALAAPYLITPGLPTLGRRSNRDVVLVFDGSASMGYIGKDGRTPHEAAKDWARTVVAGLAPGDSVTVLLARQQVVPVLGEPTHDLHQVEETIANLPPPAGTADLPQAVRQALRILDTTSSRPQREVIVLSDGQRFGWADEETLKRWQRLGADFQAEATIPPRLWVVNLDANRPAHPPNWSLTPLRTTQSAARVGEIVLFHTDLVLHGQSEYQPPHAVRLEIDGQTARQADGTPTIDVPTRADAAQLRDGKVPLSFQVALATPGVHLVSVIVEPDPPDLTPDDERRRDRLAVDNRQDFALAVLPPLPVLIVDGQTEPVSGRRSVDPLRIALAPRIDPTGARSGDRPPAQGDRPPAQGDRAPAQGVQEAAPMLARVVSIADLEKNPALVERDLEGPGTRPRVLILCDIAELAPPVQTRIEQFLAGGGGVLVSLGERADEDAYRKLWGGGQGWLPAELDHVAVADADQNVSPAIESFNHPALELFRQLPANDLPQARFRRWWKVNTPDHAAAARLTNKDPLLVEKAYRGGRVLLLTVPLDRSWDSNLPRLSAFVILAHELVNYLANVRPAEYNVQPGQPLRYPLGRGPKPPLLTVEEPAGGRKLVALQGPGADRAQLLQQDQQSVVAIENTAAPGVYHVGEGVWPFRGRSAYYVVRPDARDAERESELTPCDEAAWKAVRELLPMNYVAERDAMRSPLAQELYRQELWWWFLLGVVLLLCGEIWMTRRLVKRRT
jgi:hypothetical protein